MAEYEEPMALRTPSKQQKRKPKRQAPKPPAPRVPDTHPADGPIKEIPAPKFDPGKDEWIYSELGNVSQVEGPPPEPPPDYGTVREPAPEFDPERDEWVYRDWGANFIPREENPKRRKVRLDEEKEKLKKHKNTFIKELNVKKLLPRLQKEQVISEQDVKRLQAESRRRTQVLMLIDLLLKAGRDMMTAFLDAVEIEYPHLFLQHSGWEDDPSTRHMEDEWSVMQRARGFLIDEIDATHLLPELRKANVLNDEDVEIIEHETSSLQRRNEALLDIIETRDPWAYEAFLEVLSDLYPHLYLIISGNEIDPYDEEEDDW